MNDNDDRLAADHKFVVVDDTHLGGFAELRNLPPIDLSAVDPSRFRNWIDGEIARRASLFEDRATDHWNDLHDSAVPDQWLLIECDEPGCSESTDVDLAATEPHDEQALHAVLGGRGWSSDAKNRDLCPKHLPR
ncbi:MULTISPECIES: hypothetical protein [Mycobacterium]|uniref:Uncharacterized protein n=1 Tax=Mycobacterium kyorinense TaxID=487514 RepID=A0A1X1YIY3_9MYCO|nr:MULTISPECIES: hypothetical protein [Mycobacterium]MDA3660190.1 hypothetical protein [Mycobacterium xenopi]MDA3665023.1 hypothetical protein [Mycobacterium xenopi]ORW11062.1 hypothetical protein AWC14_19285 [Mycobacterium kyorinense]SPX88362.1 Uncharacterised protein [Mycobacterium xenopi]